MSTDWGRNPRVSLDDNISLKTSDSSEYVQHNNMYFAFVDVLGFQQTFEEHRDDETTEFAQRYQKVFGYFSRLMNNAKFMQRSGRDECVSAAGQTSDSLYFYTERIDFLAAFVKIYSHFILYAMSQDVFFRGGISQGVLFVNKPHQFYGDSVIKAFLMESTIAKLPRVAVDQKTYEELKPMLGERCFNYDKGRYYIVPFINIKIEDIAEYYDPSFEFEEIGEKQIQEIEGNIKKNHNRFEFIEGTYQKYEYLSNCFKTSEIKSAKE